MSAVAPSPTAPARDVRRVPQVRRPGFSFADLPRRWLGGRLATHQVNAANLLFPAGERFFCRSVAHYLPQVSADLRRRAGGLLGQEARHGLEHEAFFRALEAQGYELQGWLERYERLAYGRIEGATGPALHLATTSALEHYTAVLAVLALRDGLLDDADERARALLFWHAAEEIEHRSVAFDVLQEVDPRWTLRLAGFLMALATLNGFMTWGHVHLLRQEAAREGWPSVLRDLARDLLDPGPRRGLWRAVPMLLDYLRPGFHPDQAEGYEQARDYLERAARGEWATRAPWAPASPDGFPRPT